MRNPLLTATYLVCFAGAMGSALFLLFCSDPLETPSLQILPNRTLDVGTIMPGASIEFDYELRNRGSEPIRIVHVSTSCGCATPMLSEHLIARNQSSPLILKYDSGQTRGEFFVEGVVVYQKSGEDVFRSMTLHGRGTIASDYGVSPERLRFHALVPGTRHIVLSPPAR
jgi:hypothetical protein